jgi:hypothetical protein
MDAAHGTMAIHGTSTGDHRGVRELGILVDHSADDMIWARQEVRRDRLHHLRITA